MGQQIPLPRSSSPYPDDNQNGSSEQLEPETEDDMDMRDFSERPTNDKRPPKPPRKTKVMLQNLIPPLGCPDCMPMTADVAGIPKPQTTEIRGILPEKKKVPIGWPTCLKRLPPKATFPDNDIYAVHKNESEHHYEEPKEKDPQDDRELKEKNMKVFYKLNVNDKVDLANTPHEEEYADENYESVEDRETMV